LLIKTRILLINPGANVRPLQLKIYHRDVPMELSFLIIGSTTTSLPNPDTQKAESLKIAFTPSMNDGVLLQ
jgi:hypothetical protein